MALGRRNRQDSYNILREKEVSYCVSCVCVCAAPSYWQSVNQVLRNRVWFVLMCVCSCMQQTRRPFSLSACHPVCLHVAGNLSPVAWSDGCHLIINRGTCLAWLSAPALWFGSVATDGFKLLQSHQCFSQQQQQVPAGVCAVSAAQHTHPECCRWDFFKLRAGVTHFVPQYQDNIF